MSKISIIIVNYKNEDLTIKYVNEELSKVRMPHQIVIVNNAATDETDCRMAEQLNATIVYDVKSFVGEIPYISIIHNNENVGFARANNLAAEYASKDTAVDFFLFTNNDIVFIDNDVVEKLVAKLATLPDVSLIGPKVVGKDGCLQSPEPYVSFSNAMIKPYFRTFLEVVGFKTKKRNDYSTNAVEGCHYKIMGSFFAVKKNDYFRCGMMDPNTFLYYEEYILSERLARIGKKEYYYPVIAVLHDHNQTIGKYSSFKRQRDYMFNSGAYYYRIYQGVPVLYICIAFILKEISKIIGKFRRL